MIFDVIHHLLVVDRDRQRHDDVDAVRIGIE
jgi:hypothetical protein